MTDKTDDVAKDSKNVQLLNWLSDDYSMEITEGIKFDPEKTYVFELTEVKREKGMRDDKPWERLTLAWTEYDSNVVIRQNHFLNPKATLNKDAPEKSNSLVKLANQLGYKVAVGDKGFHPKHFLKLGMKIEAHVIDQIDYKTQKKSGYSEIDISTIKPFGKKAQQEIAINAEDVAKWQKEVTEGKYDKQESYVANLAKNGRLTEVAPFMEAAKAGKITFG